MLDLALRLIPITYVVLMLAVGIYIYRLGEWPERAGILIIVVGSCLTGLVASPQAWRGSEIGILIVDVLVLVAFIIVMAACDRFWPLWMSAMQIIAVATHIARLINPATVRYAYAVAEQLWAYPMLLILAVVATGLRRQRRLSTLLLDSPSQSRTLNVE